MTGDGEVSTCLSGDVVRQHGDNLELRTATATTSVSVNDELSEAKSKHQTASWSPPAEQCGAMEETEDGEVRRAISVSLEIKRFQEEINKVEAENCQFYQWKLRRVASRPSLAPSLPARGISWARRARSQESILAPPPARPPKKNHKKVSYCEAVTVFGSSESLGRSPDSHI